MRRGARLSMLLLALVLAAAACDQGGGAAEDGADAVADEDFPERPINLTVGWSAGGSSDLVSRGLAREMEEHLGGSVQITNVDGATGGVGASQVAGAQSDGYTLFGGASAHGTWPVLEQSDVGWEDFYAFLAGPHPTAIYVAADSPHETIEDLIAAMEEDPSMRYGTPGPGSNGHLFGEMILDVGEVEAEHVPYGGGSEAGQFLNAGEIEWASVTLGDVVDMAEGGQIRPVSVLYEESVELAGFEIESVLDYFPELEPQIAINPWFGIYAPRDTPPGVVLRIADAIEHATQQERFVEVFEGEFAGVVEYTVGEAADEVMARVESARAWELFALEMTERDPDELGIPAIEDFSWPPHDRASEANPWPDNLSTADAS